MAVKTIIQILTAQYDESQEDLLGVYGVTDEELKKVFELFSSDEAIGKTFAERLVELINAGEISGGLLLLLATQQIKDTLKTAAMRRQVEDVFYKLLGSSLGFNENENEDEDDEDWWTTRDGEN